jgi:sulfur-carrier protein adenylyltransferase/sulfurtransferase
MFLRQLFTAHQSYRDIDPGELISLKRARVIDVRQPEELTGPLGHIEGVEHIPAAELAAASRHWDRSEPIVVICRSGGRSAAAAGQLARVGFTQVMNLRGGMLAWNQAGLPVAAGS